MDIYQCEECGKIFDEFEMNFKAAQEDKKTLCRECRKKLGSTSGAGKKEDNVARKQH